MDVLMQIRKDAEKNPGGDLIQLIKTKEFLEKFGVKVDISLSHKENLNKYTIVHLFNVTRITDTYLYFQNAWRQHKKIVISPIYHPLTDMQSFYKYTYKVPFFDIAAYSALKEIYYSLKSKTACSLKCILNYRNTVKHVLLKSDMILPNSFMEFECMRRELEVDNRYKVIPNATEIMPNASYDSDNRNNVILSVARVEPRKNQLNIIKAFKRAEKRLPPDTELIFIGAINKSHRIYAHKFLKAIEENNRNIKYLGVLPHEEVIHKFKKAKLLVLASFFETTGLVGLEALSCGAKVVMTEQSYTKEYYENSAVFCNPSSVNGISEAIIRGFYDKYKKEGIDRLIEKCSWENTARLTLMAYNEVLLSAS